MPFIVIEVDSKEDVDKILFNDKHANTQYIGDSSSESIAFSVFGVIDEPD